jgi:cyclopropane fatty-acyl-phospholipid synthase-like methyltransferase
VPEAATVTDKLSVRDFQRLYLDDRMHHSSGWFRDRGVPLDEAQVEKSRRLFTTLEIEPGMKVLDVGCSWGGLSRWMAERGADVTGLTVDPEHKKAMPRIPGLNIVVQRWQDYSGLVDRVACINALENFNDRPAFFHNMREWLRPGGRAVIWVVTADSAIYRAPSLPDVLKWSADAGLDVLSLTTGLAQHYARTLGCFASNLEAAKIPLKDLSANQMKQFRLRFYRISERLLDSGRNDMVEIVLGRAA